MLFSIRLAVVFSIVFVTPAFSAPTKNPSAFFTIEAGAYLSNLKERLQAPGGYASHVSSFSGVVRLHSGIHLGKGWYIEPAFGTILPTRDGADGSTSAFRSHIDLNLGIPLLSFLRFRAGPGVQWEMHLSQAQTISLDNGTGESDFYIPERTSQIFLFTVQSGFTIRFSQHWALYLDVYVPQIISKLRRRYHASATIGFTL